MPGIDAHPLISETRQPSNQKISLRFTAQCNLRKTKDELKFQCTTCLNQSIRKRRKIASASQFAPDHGRHLLDCFCIISFFVDSE